MSGQDRSMNLEGGNPTVRYMDRSGWPIRQPAPITYADGSTGPNAPTLPGPTGNPFIDPATGQRYPGAPG